MKKSSLQLPSEHKDLSSELKRIFFLPETQLIDFRLYKFFLARISQVLDSYDWEQSINNEKYETSRKYSYENQMNILKDLQKIQEKIKEISGVFTGDAIRNFDAAQEKIFQKYHVTFDKQKCISTEIKSISVSSQDLVLKELSINQEDINLDNFDFYLKSACNKEMDARRLLNNKNFVAICTGFELALIGSYFPSIALNILNNDNLLIKCAFVNISMLAHSHEHIALTIIDPENDLYRKLIQYKKVLFQSLACKYKTVALKLLQNFEKSDIDFIPIACVHEKVAEILLNNKKFFKKMSLIDLNEIALKHFHIIQLIKSHPECLSKFGERSIRDIEERYSFKNKRIFADDINGMIVRGEEKNIYSLLQTKDLNKHHLLKCKPLTKAIEQGQLNILKLLVEKVKPDVDDLKCTIKKGNRPAFNFFLSSYDGFLSSQEIIDKVLPVIDDLQYSKDEHINKIGKMMLAEYKKIQKRNLIHASFFALMIPILLLAKGKHCRINPSPLKNMLMSNIFDIAIFNMVADMMGCKVLPYFKSGTKPLLSWLIKEEKMNSHFPQDRGTDAVPEQPCLLDINDGWSDSEALDDAWEDDVCDNTHLKSKSMGK